MSSEAIRKFVNLDSIYFFSCIFLLLLIISDQNFLDAVYLFVVTFYYIRIKVCRKKS